MNNFTDRVSSVSYFYLLIMIVMVFNISIRMDKNVNRLKVVLVDKNPLIPHLDLLRIMY